MPATGYTTGMEQIALFPFVAPELPPLAGHAFPLRWVRAETIAAAATTAPNSVTAEPPATRLSSANDLAFKLAVDPSTTAAGAASDFPKDDLDAMIERAEGTLTRVLQSGRSICVSYSAGKDSSCVLNLLLAAAAKLAKASPSVVVPPIVVQHADTMIENAAIHAYAKREMSQIAAFAKAHGLDVTIEVSQPSLSQQWAVRVIGGRALPSFPSNGRDCTTELKIAPMKRLRKAALRRLAGAKDALEPLVLLGTRYGESSVRNAGMTERGESDLEIRRGIDEKGKQSHLFLSPIAWWDTDAVWMYLGMARSKAILAYSDFDETFRVYADAMAVSCVIVAEDMAKAVKGSKACGSRHGCALCLAAGAKDKSMENMLASDEQRYGFMRGVNKLRNFIASTQWDLSRRSWLGRTINHGFIRIGPDAYSPAMMEELLRYALTLDMEEQAAAARARVAPRFTLISLQALFAIDSVWSLQAYHRPFHALAIWKDIVLDGRRYPVPEVAEFPKGKIPPPLYLHVGPDWDEGLGWEYTGLRDMVLEAVRHEGDGCRGNRVLKNGLEVLDVCTEDLFDIDIEAASLVLELELEDLLARHHEQVVWDGPAAYRYYVGLGMLSITKGKEAKIDEMLRRSSFKHRYGFAGQIDHRALLAHAVSAKEAGLVETTNGKRHRRGAAGSRSILVEDLSIKLGAHMVPAEQESYELAA